MPAFAVVNAGLFLSNDPEDRQYVTRKRPF